MSQKEFKIGDKVRIVPVWDGLPREGTGVIMHITPPGVETPEHIAVAAYGDAYKPFLCRRMRETRYFVRRDNPRNVDNPYLITCSTLPIELIDKVAPGHNPDKLTVEQVGDGWWLPEWEVLEKITKPIKVQHIQGWWGKKWCRTYESNDGLMDSGSTYRTRLPREELLKLIAPKKRLIRVEELPAVCFVKRYGEAWYESVVRRDPEAQRIVLYGDSWVSILHALACHWQWSSDLKTWNSFEIEEDTK